MYTLKSIARRSTALGMAVAVVAAAVMPAAAVFADALNPLTERSLLLSSSAPGFMDKDGSGNSAGSPNALGENYAPAGSGPNGKKAGQTFTFTHSSAATIRGFSLQYCTSAAGLCQAPGNNPGDAKSGAPLARSANTDANAHAAGKSDFDFVGAFTNHTQPAVPTFSTQYGGVSPEEPDAADYTDDELDTDYIADMALYNGYMTASVQAAGSFQVLVNGVPSNGWTFAKANLESATHSGALTGKNNYVTLVSATGAALTQGDVVKIRFVPSESIYITNPGADEFFVKINTYSSDTNLIGNHNDATPADQTDHTVVDGGVTVANVMTDSIHITTKVLETMAFSVGIENRDTKDIGGSGQLHGKCDPILTTNSVAGTSNNRLNLGNPDAEYSLETGMAWDVHSYWRLSSNSSGGASVYYSGDTLRNTVGDHIKEMDTEVVSTPGTEQFGLGFVDAGLDTMDADGDVTWANGSAVAHQALVRSYPFRTMSTQIGVAPFDTLAAQGASDDYDEATGTIFTDPGGGAPIAAGTAKFKFLSSSMTVPELIAQQNETVISCATAKMRYVANIGADTPAGVYTTKINYLAAPQY